MTDDELAAGETNDGRQIVASTANIGSLSISLNGRLFPSASTPPPPTGKPSFFRRIVITVCSAVTETSSAANHSPGVSAILR